MKKNKKLILMLTATVLLLTLGVSGTIAYLIDTTDDVENTFTPANVASKVVETFEDNVKSDVKIKNTGNTDAIIRAAIVVTWKDAQGNTMAQKPVPDTDYTLTLNVGDAAGQWTSKNEGDMTFYYWNETVEPDATTGVLIKECKLTETGADYTDRTLCVEVIGSAIQSNKTWDSVKVTPAPAN